MKKAIFGLQEKRGPWTFKKTRKTRFRDIFTFRVFGVFGPSPLTEAFSRKKIYKKKVSRAPPSPEGGEGGDPPFRAQPGIKSTPKIVIATEKKRE